MNDHGFFYTTGNWIRFYDRGADRSTTIATIKHKGKRDKTCWELNKITESKITKAEQTTIVEALR